MLKNFRILGFVIIAGLNCRVHGVGDILLDEVDRKTLNVLSFTTRIIFGIPPLGGGVEERFYQQVDRQREIIASDTR